MVLNLVDYIKKQSIVKAKLSLVSQSSKWIYNKFTVE